MFTQGNGCMFRWSRNVLRSVCAALTVGSLLALAGCSSEEAPSDSLAPEDTSEAVVTPVPEAPTSESSLTEQEIVAKAIADRSPEVRLGVRLFHENRLSNPGANLAASCRTCHVPPEVSGNKTVYNDTIPLSVIPSNERGGKLKTRRNAPMLLDVATETSFGMDGAFDTLDAFLANKLTSDHMGWTGSDDTWIKDEFFALLLNDQGEDALAEGSYIEQFKAVKGVDLEAIDRDQAFDLIIASITDYLNTLTSAKSSAWDALAYLNRFNEGLAGEGDTPEALSGRMYGRIANQEGRVLIRFPNVYEEDAYQGMKAFIRVIPTWSSSVIGMEENIANCIACHTPPLFSDDKFHNIGTTQFAYDAEHGDGAFMNLDLSTTDADLGRYGIDPQDSTVGAFKTPKLRNNDLTGPYMHDGSYATVEDAIRAHVKAADLAKEGKLRNPDPALITMRGLTDTDIANLVAFLQTLHEVPLEEFRDFRIANVRIRQDPLGEQDFDN